MFLASLLESSSPVGLKPAKFWSRIIVLMFKASQQWSRQKLCMRRLIPIASLPTSMFACCWYQTLRIQSFPVASVRNPSLLLFLFWDAFFAEFVLRLLPAFSFWIDTSTGYQLYLNLQKVELKLLSSSSEVWFGFFFPLSFYLLSFIPPWFDEEEKKKKNPSSEAPKCRPNCLYSDPDTASWDSLTQEDLSMLRDLTSPGSPVLQSLTSSADSKDSHTGLPHQTKVTCLQCCQEHVI